MIVLNVLSKTQYKGRLQFLACCYIKSWKIGFNIYTNLGIGFEIQVGPLSASIYIKSKAHKVYGHVLDEFGE